MKIRNPVHAPPCCLSCLEAFRSCSNFFPQTPSLQWPPGEAEQGLRVAKVTSCVTMDKLLNFSAPPTVSKWVNRHHASRTAPGIHPALYTCWLWLLEKELAAHSSILAWKIPWTEEPGRLQSMGSQRVGHNWATSLYLVISCLITEVQERKSFKYR